MTALIKASSLREGRWRNGMGVSWDIASDPPAETSPEFGWRFAIARIDGDVPFSHYPDTDRIFTLIEGGGLDLDFAGGETLAVHRLFVPHPYACDVDTFCRLRAGPCRALNLFLKRGRWEAAVDILSSNAMIDHPGPMIFFALKGASEVNGHELAEGDTLIAADHASARVHGLLYAARLTRL
jgi:uncharacterized protein